MDRNMMSCIYDEETGHYIANDATVMFQNFSGEEQDYNQAGKRNFRLILNESLADELQKRGVHVRVRPPRDETESPQYMTKVSVYPDADILMVSGRVKSQMVISRNPDEDDGPAIDREFRKGHVRNGELRVEFHVTRNSRVANGPIYLRLDSMVIPIRKSKLMEEYEDYETRD